MGSTLKGKNLLLEEHILFFKFWEKILSFKSRKKEVSPNGAPKGAKSFLLSPRSKFLRVDPLRDSRQK